MPELPDNWINPDFDLGGVDSNALAVMGAVRRALKKAGNPPDVLDAYREAATSGDYDRLLAVSMLYAGMMS